MGLSVVYEAMRRLQGDLDLQPVPGGGTRITLSVPLSVVSHRLMVVNSGNHTYAIPVPGIERVRRIEPSNVETAGGKPVLVVDGQPLPLAGISALLGLANPSDPAENAPERHAVILRSGSRRIALAVEKVAREVDAVVQDLPYATGCGGKVSAGVILDDGSIAFVVNPMELIQSAFQPRPHAQPFFPPKRPEPAGKPAPEANAAAATILVVDDSMTTRALEKSILEANGYRVRVAVDGIDALASLRRDSANLVISDIEMPNLDGFGLIEAMKRDPALAKIPVIVVSSVERREDQERGLAVGADAYIVKRKFDQQELLSVIRQIV
jgi:two-component system chemotaxis sensor kinase CheA